METFLEFTKEILKGVIRAISVHCSQKILRKHRKTTLRRHKVKGGSQKNN